MQRNVGRVDAAARIVLGVSLLGAAGLVVAGVVTTPVVSAVGLALAAIVLVVEGATRRCLLYGLLGIDRCPVD
ncbi:MAG: protein of unknown function (DUF2892) [halophilic archaeon J07HX5]|nr:MAG: protein of unknown function (DUF2892) [halophilic archaeon J07HX5]